MTDAETGEMQFDGGGKDISQEAQAVSKSREMQGNCKESSPLRPSEGTSSADNLVFQPHKTQLLEL